MAAFIARRLLLLPLVAFGVTLLIFALLQFLSPAERAGLFVTDPRQLSQIGSIIRKYGLDQPVHVQYWNWLKQLARGDLGWSQTARMPTAQAIASFFPATFELTFYMFVPIILIGIWLGTQAAVHKDRFVDHFSRFFAISLRGLPSFVWGLIVLKAQWWIFLDALRHIAGPALTLVLVEMALLVRITRSSMLEVLRQDYVRTARAKGLDEPVVIRRHARRNALIPVITLR